MVLKLRIAHIYLNTCIAYLINQNLYINFKRCFVIFTIFFYNPISQMYMSESEILGTSQNARIKCYFSPLSTTGYIKNGLRCL